MITSMMPGEKIEARLTCCFQAVFPILDRRQIGSATPETVELWDSIATVRLAAVIEEEFGVVLEMNSNLSFVEILSYLRQRLAVA
jgi:acyl carrier protein